jgi:predicted patatin/cPLA2 family phospholipase
MVVSHKRGNEKQAADKLTDLWKNIESKDILVQWPFPGPIQGLFSKSSFFDSRPELELVTSRFQRNGGNLHRGISIGVVDADTGKFHAINQDVDVQKIPTYVMASSAVPGLFISIVEGNHTYIDGFTVDNLNLRGGIQECRKLVGDDSRIIVDMILVNPFAFPKHNIKNYTTYEVYQRANELRSFNKRWFYILDIIRAHPKVNFRYIVRPSKTLPNWPIIPLVLLQRQV